MTTSPITIEWNTYNLSNSVKIECLSECTITGDTGNCVVNVTDTLGEIFYRCRANHSGFTNFSDVFLDKNSGKILLYFR